MTQCQETLRFTMWLTKLQLNSLLVAISSRNTVYSPPPHPNEILVYRKCSSNSTSHVPTYIMSESKRVHLAEGIHLYSGIREKTTRQPDEGELLWKPEKKVVTMSDRRTFFQFSRGFRFRPVTRRNVRLFGAYEIIIFLLLEEKNEQLQTDRCNGQIKYLIFYKHFLIC